MKQLELQLPNPPTVDLDGHTDSFGIRYIGKATQQFDGSWRCLADLGGLLCLVKLNLKPKP